MWNTHCKFESRWVCFAKVVVVLSSSLLNSVIELYRSSSKCCISCGLILDITQHSFRKPNCPTQYSSFNDKELYPESEETITHPRRRQPLPSSVQDDVLQTGDVERLEKKNETQMQETRCQHSAIDKSKSLTLQDVI